MQLGEYTVTRELARGGQGAVFAARRADGRAVAIKLLLAGQGATPEQRRRFAREVEALTRLRHPHVVAILDAGTHQGAPYLVMDYVAGRSLAERLQREGPLPPRQAAELAAKLARALEHAHAQNVLHRDLKPGNVLLDERGEPLLTDFGLTRDVDPSSSATQLSSEGRFMGTPGYLAPEQARGELAALGPAADVFGLGALLYATLTCRPPWEGVNLVELLVRMQSPPAPPRGLRPEIDPELERICLRCLAWRPEDRPPSARALVGELEGYLAGVGAPPGGRPGEGRPRRRVALLCAALLTLAGLLGWALRRDPVEQAWRLLDRSSPERASRARELLDEVLSADSARPRALALRALARQELDDPEGAEADVARALELDPDCAFGHYARAWLLLRQGAYEAALGAVDRSIALDPRRARFHVLRAVVLGQMGGEGRSRTREAIQAYARALELDPDLDDVVEARGSLLVHEEDYAAAVEAFTRLLELRPADPEAWAQRGGVRHLAGDAQGALADLGRSLELDARRSLTWLKRGGIREEQGDLAGAVADYERCLALEPVAGLQAGIDELRARLERAPAPR